MVPLRSVLTVYKRQVPNLVQKAKLTQLKITHPPKTVLSPKGYQEPLPKSVGQQSSMVHILRDYGQLLSNLRWNYSNYFWEHTQIMLNLKLCTEPTRTRPNWLAYAAYVTYPLWTTNTWSYSMTEEKYALWDTSMRIRIITGIDWQVENCTTKPSSQVNSIHKHIRYVQRWIYSALSWGVVSKGLDSNNITLHSIQWKMATSHPWYKLPHISQFTLNPCRSVFEDVECPYSLHCKLHLILLNSHQNRTSCSKEYKPCQNYHKEKLTNMPCPRPAEGHGSLLSLWMMKHRT